MKKFITISTVLILIISCYIFYKYSLKHEEEQIVKWIKEQHGFVTYSAHPFTAALPGFLKPFSKFFLGEKIESISILPMKNYEPMHGLNDIKLIEMNFLLSFSFDIKEETEKIKKLFPDAELEIVEHYVHEDFYVEQEVLFQN